MARYSALRWQFWLYLLRLISFSGMLASHTYFYVGEPSSACTPLVIYHAIPRLGCIFYFWLAPIIVIVNDVAMVVWDAIFSGGFIATACFQTVVSLLVTIFLIFRLRSDLAVALGYHSWDSIPWLGLAFEISSMLATLVLIASTLLACRKKPIRTWMQGMKELAIRLPPDQSVSMFGKRRRADDGIRIVWMGACSWGVRATMKSLKLGFIRRVPESETLKYALGRNLTALMLTCILFLQAILLIISVINQQQSGIKQTWQHIDFDFISPSRIVAEWSASSRDIWASIHMLAHSSSVTVNMSELLQSGFETTFDHSNLSLPFDFAKNDAISIGVVGIPDAPLTAKIQLNLRSPDGMLPDDLLESRIVDTMFMFAPRIKLTNGIHTFGSLTLIERRLARPSLAEIIGISPPNYLSVMLPVADIHQTEHLPLEDQSIARVTLTWNLRRFWPVLVDERARTWIDVLGSIGGLLAIFQGLHVLLFGQPLWWGLFGSKTIDPFGLCGGRSPSSRKRMIARYGYIPTAENEEDGSSTDHRLRLFLNDFVIDMGQLVKREDIDEVPDVGEGVVNPPDSPSRDVDVAVEGRDAGTGILTVGRDTSV